jgi:hypothetical protein
MTQYSTAWSVFFEVPFQIMADGGEFDGAKAYKDSKVCNMLTMAQLHK